MLECEREIRQYAMRLNPYLGEDAFHSVICEVLERNIILVNEVAFYHVAIKRALWKIFRHEKADRKTSLAFLNGDPPASEIGLRAGRKLMNVRRSHCRNGRHELVEGNLTYVGGRRTCLACKRIREVCAARKYRRKVRVMK